MKFCFKKAFHEVEYLVEMNCVKPLVDLLAVSDAKIIGVALEALENILKACL